MDQNGLKCTKMDQNGPKWTEMDQNGLKYTEMDQSGSKPFNNREHTEGHHTQDKYKSHVNSQFSET